MPASLRWLPDSHSGRPHGILSGPIPESNRRAAPKPHRGERDPARWPHSRNNCVGSQFLRKGFALLWRAGSGTSLPAGFGCGAQISWDPAAVAQAVGGHPSRALRAVPVRAPPCCQCPAEPTGCEPVLRRPWFPGTLRWQLPRGRVFFRAVLGGLRFGQLVGNINELVGQMLEALVILHVLSHLRGLFCRDTLGDLLPLAKKLENIIRAIGADDAALFATKGLCTQGATPQTLDGLDFLKNGLPLLFKVFAHELVVVSL